MIGKYMTCENKWNDRPGVLFSSHAPEHPRVDIEDNDYGL